MGSKEEDVPVEPIQKVVFMEDMNEDELACVVSIRFCQLEGSYRQQKCLLDGLSCGLDQFRQHMLHERHHSMPQNCS